MYLLGIYFENARKNGDGRFCFKKDREKIRKWTQLPAGRSNQELLQLMAVACAGYSFLRELPYALGRFCRNPDVHLQLEFILSTHHLIDSRSDVPPLLGSGIRIDGKGQVKRLTEKDCHLLPSALPIRKPALGTGNSRCFLLAYGTELKHHNQTDDFNFTDPFFRVTRFHSLFNKEALVTDPVAFLTLLHYKGVLKSRFPAKWTMERLIELFRKYIGIETGCWMERKCDFRKEWSQLRSWQSRAALPILDVVRHMIDAFPKSGTPLNMPGLMLLNRPDCFCTKKGFSDWITLMDLLLPEMQFVVTLYDNAISGFPNNAQKKRLTLPVAVRKPIEKRQARIPRDAILLLDVDSRLPNLALMKLSRYFKEQGRRVILARKEIFIKRIEKVYASCVFHSPASQKRISKLRDYYGKSLILGGSGVDIRERLPSEIEKLPADYTLYPELKDRAIGFITRGCPFDCPFCIVPIKEGKTHQVSNLDSLLEDGRRKLILLDDNILSHPDAGNFLEEMAQRNLQVNFTQTFDLRMIDKEKARIIRRIYCSNLKFTRRVYHFSLNDARNLDRVRRKYQILGFTSGDNVEFICMYGYNTSLAEDVERFRFLRSLPGAYVFVQEYQPIPDGPPADLTHFFDDNADEYIDELIGIVFRQNMKSMEKYYRWLSKRYVQALGKLHNRLVDTIFRYNNRDSKGRYIATMARTKGKRDKTKK
ncbi:MAG: hypothetical protein ACT6FD_06700 [Methanosarcinaceae archaeon]